MINAILEIPVYNDSPRAVAHMHVRREYVDKLAQDSGLLHWVADSVSYYVCADGAVLVLWGRIDGQTAIRGCVLPLSDLPNDSEFKLVWEKHHAQELTVEDIHASIVQALQQTSN